MLQNSSVLRYRYITADYMRGLVDGEGCFTFCSAGKENLIPTFVISMHVRDQKLLVKVADFLNIKGDVNVYKTDQSDGYKHGMMARLMVRDLPGLRDIVTPFFYKKLLGYKADQFNTWIERIGNDPLVPERYKIIHSMYKSGYWDKKENYADLMFWGDINIV